MNINWSGLQIRELALVVGKKLAEHNIDFVLVGGACVSIYSENRYISGDLDFISYTEQKKISAALKELGFELQRHKYYVHENCKLFLEFLSPPVSVGNEAVKKFKQIKEPIGEINLLTPIDCVKDRLAAYYHWNDRQSLEQAVLVAQGQEIDFLDLKKWSIKEGHEKKFNDFIKILNTGI